MFGIVMEGQRKGRREIEIETRVNLQFGP